VDELKQSFEETLREALTRQRHDLKNDQEEII
jgi:hypothetical protein